MWDIAKDVAHWFRRMYDNLHNSNFFIGVMLLIANFGSRYIELELSDTQQEFLTSNFMRMFFIFCAAFAATKDLFHSFVLTAVFMTLATSIFDERSNYSILPESFKAKARDAPSASEVAAARRVLARHERAQRKEHVALHAGAVDPDILAPTTATTTSTRHAA